MFLPLPVAPNQPAIQWGLQCVVEDGDVAFVVPEGSEFPTTPLPEDAVAALEASEETAPGPIVNRCVPTQHLRSCVLVGLCRVSCVTILPPC